MTTFPQDKAKYEATDTVIRQTDCQSKYGESNAEFTIRFYGEAGAVTQLASSYRQNTRVPLSTLMSDFAELSSISASAFKTYGKVIQSSATTKEGGTAQATIVVAIPYDKKTIPSYEGDEPEETKIVTWSEKSTKYEFPLEVFAGDVESDSTEYANAGDYAAWLKEDGTNAENYKNFAYGTTDGIVALSGNTLELAKKHYGGIENVERAYPEVIRTTTYSYIKGDETEADKSIVRQIDEEPNLYYIDNTPSATWSDKFSDFSWLKTSYDVEITESEYEGFWNAVVVESWIGVSIPERGAWDNDLYGKDESRWKFYTAQLSA